MARTEVEKLRSWEKYTPVHILWFDAAALGFGWTAEDLLEQDDLMCQTAGFLLSVSDISVLICHSYHSGADVNGAFSIPLGMILKARKLSPTSK